MLLAHISEETGEGLRLDLDKKPKAKSRGTPKYIFWKISIGISREAQSWLNQSEIYRYGRMRGEDFFFGVDCLSSALSRSGRN